MEVRFWFRPLSEEHLYGTAQLNFILLCVSPKLIICQVDLVSCGIK